MTCVTGELCGGRDETAGGFLREGTVGGGAGFGGRGDFLTDGLIGGGGGGEGGEGVKGATIGIGGDGGGGGGGISISVIISSVVSCMDSTKESISDSCVPRLFTLLVESHPFIIFLCLSSTTIGGSR